MCRRPDLGVEPPFRIEPSTNPPSGAKLTASGSRPDRRRLRRVGVETSAESVLTAEDRRVRRVAEVSGVLSSKGDLIGVFNTGVEDLAADLAGVVTGEARDDLDKRSGVDSGFRVFVTLDLTGEGEEEALEDLLGVMSAAFLALILVGVGEDLEARLVFEGVTSPVCSSVSSLVEELLEDLLEVKSAMALMALFRADL